MDWPNLFWNSRSPAIKRLILVALGVAYLATWAIPWMRWIHPLSWVVAAIWLPRLAQRARNRGDETTGWMLALQGGTLRISLIVFGVVWLLLWVGNRL